MYIVKFYLLFIVICKIRSAKILGVFQLPSYSHYQLGEALLKQLALKGHDVTIITPISEQQNIENLKIIPLTSTDEASKAPHFNLFNLAYGNALISSITAERMMVTNSERTLNHPNVQKLIKSDEKFDLVIIERLLNDALLGFCGHFKAHCVVLSPLPLMSSSNIQMGNFVSPSYLPDIQSGLPSKMNFMQRVYNSVVYLVNRIDLYVTVLPNCNNIMHKYFPTISHDLIDIFHNVSITLINSHIGTNRVIPLLPNMIEIGGYHIKPLKPLPSSLQDYLDNANEGVILFSLGSNLRSQDLTNERRESILNAFSALKEKVLWKWENDSLPHQPLNVKISKWVPQNDVLAHPNINLFITHGGSLSTYEAVYYGVPMVGIPVYGDQNSNMKFIEESNMGVTLPFVDLTADNLLKCIKKVLQDPIYQRNTRIRSKIFRDNPIGSLDKAVYWIEYVLRHNGAHHLKTSGLQLHWYQFFLLDVLVFIAFIVLAPIFIFYWICKRRHTKMINVIKKTK